LALAALVGPPAPATVWPDAFTSPLSEKPRAHFVLGETSRIDLRRRLLVLRPDGEAKELEIAIESATRITSGGRTLSLEGLRAGDRLAVSCADPHGGEHVARRVAVRAAVRRSPSPAASAAPPAGS
jgi:hypothetical protein